MFLFVDTETTGKPLSYSAPVSDLDNWPRIVQIAWTIAESAESVLKSVCHTILPDGFTIPDDVVAIHGITTEMAMKSGIPLKEAMSQLMSDAVSAKAVVAHNISFDIKIIAAEYFRLSLNDPLELLPRRCTMIESTKWCQIPSARGYKWPRLGELHQKLFGTQMSGSHDAANDTEACMKCFFELRKLGVIE